MRFLFIEDSAQAIELTLAELRRYGFDPDHTRVDTSDALIAAMQDGSWSAVISEYRIGADFTGMDAVSIVRRFDREVPFLILSDLDSEDRAFDLMRAGANDYVTKDRLYRLAPTIEREIRDVQLRHERRMFFDAMRRSEDRYRRIFERAPIGVAATASGGDLVAVNERLSSLLGYPPEEMIGRRLADFAHPDDAATMHEQPEHRYLTKDGAVVWTKRTAAPVLSEGEIVDQVVWLIEDITDQKRQQHELERRAAQQTAIADFGQAALRGEPIETLLAQVAEAVSTLLDADFSAILQEMDGRFTRVAGKGWREAIRAERFNAMMSRHTLQTGGPVVVTRLAEETRFTPPRGLVEKGVVSCVTVPISTGRVAAWGVLGVYSRVERQFTVHEVEFLRAIAIVLAQAIERDRVDQQLVLHAAQQSSIAELTRIALHSVDDAV
ncbi:MAG TPA: GAF domain-containing protein, partial [Thermoanaerobaculia bacterium]|nr:GAF domain-containing protein [Thermoanaerobaculia bacterium]